ncbi:MAG: hypothetical protein Q4G40_12800, partial [Brachybacterium sp.]|nr:hypothetical protein [Brachybacterium sp.]
MNQLIGVWPNVTRLLVAYLTDRTGYPVFTRRPGDGWKPNLPCFFLDRQPAPPSDGYTKIYTFDVEFMSTDLDEANAGASEIEILMFTLPSESDTTAHVDDVEEVMGVFDPPHDDPEILRMVGTYNIAV